MIPDRRMPTCPVCGYRATVQYARHLRWVASHGIPPGHRFAGLVVRCEECSTARHASIIPFWFTDDVLALSPNDGSGT